jgi:hypothetical protein
VESNYIKPMFILSQQKIPPISEKTFLRSWLPSLNYRTNSTKNLCHHSHQFQTEHSSLETNSIYRWKYWGSSVWLLT